MAADVPHRAGQTLNYTLDGLLATSSGVPELPGNPNPSATAGTQPAPAAGTAGSASSRYYDASGNLVGIIDGSGTTVTIGSATAHATTTGAKTATRSYEFLGKVVAQRTASGTTVRLAFVVSDSVNTTQTILQPTTTTASATAITRYTDPFGLARGATQSATGTGAYATAPTAAKGTGSNSGNLAGFGAANGYINGLADTVSALTHLGARDLDRVTGAFTTPDPALKPDEARNFSAYVYSEGDPINGSDPSGLIMKPALAEGGSRHGVGAKVSPGRWAPRPDVPLALGNTARAWPKWFPATVQQQPWAIPGAACNDEMTCYVLEHGVAKAAATALPYAGFALGSFACIPAGLVCATLGTGFFVGGDAAANAIEGKQLVDGDDAVTVAANALGAAKFNKVTSAAGKVIGALSNAGGKAKPGAWATAAESMSSRAAAYQARITGQAAGSVYVVNGVKFDGYANGILQEAKGPEYARFVKNGQFQPWFGGAESLASQAQRQLAAAGGTPITWSVAEADAATAINNLLTSRGISGIAVSYVP